GIQPLRKRDQIKRNGNPQTDFQGHGTGFRKRVATQHPYSKARLHQHAVSKGVVAVMDDASTRGGLLPTIPQPGLREIVVGLNEEVLLQVVPSRQAMVVDILFRGDGNEMKLAELSEPNVG